jgi:rhodanese-related sulfurtransferase
MKSITRDELKKMMDGNAPLVIIDARDHDEFEIEHLPGAVSVPSGRIGMVVLTRFRKTDRIVTYCTDRNCEASEIVASKLEKFGFVNVLELKGGIEEWKEAGYPVEK